RPAARSRWTAVSATRSPGEVRFGVQLGRGRPDSLRTLAERIEALGFDSIWVGDHVSFHTPTLDSLSVLTYVAAVTRRVRLGPCVYLLALRHPTVAAKTVATLDVLSGGRVVFGVGVGGEFPKEFEACGVPHAERGRRVDEGIAVSHALAAQALSGQYNQPFDELAKRYCLLGSPAQRVETLARFVEAGVRTFVLAFMAGSERLSGQLERFAGEVLPSFRAGVSS